MKQWQPIDLIKLKILAKWNANELAIALGLKPRSVFLYLAEKVEIKPNICRLLDYVLKDVEGWVKKKKLTEMRERLVERATELEFAPGYHGRDGTHYKWASSAKVSAADQTLLDAYNESPSAPLPSIEPGFLD